MKKYIERIVAVVGYLGLAFFILILVLVITIWGAGINSANQLLAGNAKYDVSTIINKETGKESIFIYCHFSQYPKNISNEELEVAVIKTILRVRRENPEVDTIAVRGQSDGVKDIKECHGWYRKETPKKVYFVNYGWTTNKKADYEKILELPEN